VDPDENAGGGSAAYPYGNEPPAGDTLDDIKTTEENEGTKSADTETAEEERLVKDSAPVGPEEGEDSGKGAEENPTIESTDDPEKAFGYEE
jgi:hypothetical protein